MNLISGIYLNKFIREKIIDLEENINENMASLNQEVYMDFLNELFVALGNGANSYDDSTWTAAEEELARVINGAIEAANIDLV